MEKLKYFIVKKEDSPLWQEYINWLNTQYKQTWQGTEQYYGCDGYDCYNGTSCHATIGEFKNNPTLLTLEQWKEMFINEEFILPENWCVKITPENSSILKKWRNSQSDFNKFHTCGLSAWFISKEYDGTYRYWCNDMFDKYKEITFEQFKKHILMENKIDYTISRTPLPVIPEGTNYRVVGWSNDIKTISFPNKKEFISFGTKLYNGETYVLCDTMDYTGSIYYMIKLSDIEKLAEIQEKSEIESSTQYFEYVDKHDKSFALGKIYKLNKNNKLTFDSSHECTGYHHENINIFKPSTKELFDAQNKSFIPEYVECIHKNNASMHQKYTGKFCEVGQIYKVIETSYPETGVYSLVHVTECGVTIYVHATKTSTKEEFEQQDLKKEETMKTITYEQAQQIIDIACNTWKDKLFNLWGKNIVLKQEVEISDNEYQKMRKACTSEQNKLFDAIFGKDEPKFKVGDWVQWNGIVPLTAQIISFDGKYCKLNEDSHANCYFEHIRLATEEEIKKAKYIPEGTACLVKDYSNMNWQLAYSDGEGKFKGSSHSSVSWNQFQVLYINNLPKY